MRHAVLGATGQLGREFVARLAGDVQPFTREQIDLALPDALAALRALRPKVVINCAAYNLVDQAERDPEAAFAVNAFGVRRLALLCREIDCTLVHFSTDYVFGQDAARRTPYTETDAPGPVSAYGVSKLAGEHFVRALCPKHLVIRTCGLYGRPAAGGKGGNFVETMLRLAVANKPIRVVADQTCTPTYAVDLTSATLALLAVGNSGLDHVTNAGACTWYEFAQAIFELAGLQPSLAPITSAEYGAPARRPGYSVLGTIHPDPALRPWRQALADYLSARRPAQ